VARCDRRTALRALATGAAAAWVDSLSALAAQHAHSPAAQGAIAAQEWTPRVLNPHQNETVITLTELIIPQTETPGAKAARVNRFIDTVLQHAKPADRDSFLRGLTWMDERSRTQFRTDFVAATAAQQTELLTTLSKGEGEPPELRTGTQFFRAIKSMTIDGFYTTEIGLRQELGDNGQLFLVQFAGCDHPEHQG
jgi:glucoside 3-dehydrogenase (cytochrome c) hitch-hiker subunit